MSDIGSDSLPVIVIGAGGHAKVVVDLLQCAGRTVLGLTDPDPDRVAGEVLGVAILGSDAVLTDHRPEEVELANGIGSTEPPTKRQDLYDQLVARGYRFATLVHPSAIVARDADMGPGAQLMAGTIIQPGVRIGPNCIVNTGATIDHDCIIGAHVHIAPGVTLSGAVEVGDATHIGTGASIIQGVSIGAGCMVRAGAVITEDVMDGARVGRVPSLGGEHVA